MAQMVVLCLVASSQKPPNCISSALLLCLDHDAGEEEDATDADFNLCYYTFS